MAEVPVTLNGVLYDLYGRTTQRVVFIGDASYTGLAPGGGPMPGGPPLGFWGGVAPPYPDHGLPPPVGIWPSPGHPAHPISPGGPPPGIWPSPGVPTHPIVIPPTEPPPVGEADKDGFIKPPPAGGGWAYHEDYKWLYSPSVGSPGPKVP
jgi:hypothetical protein